MVSRSARSLIVNRSYGAVRKKSNQTALDNAAKSPAGLMPVDADARIIRTKTSAEFVFSNWPRNAEIVAAATNGTSTRADHDKTVLCVLPSPRGILMFRAPRSDDWGVLSAGCGRPARTPFGLLVRALAMVVPASKCGVCCLSLVGPGIWWRVGGMGDLPVETLFPKGRERFEWGSSRWSRVLGIKAVGGPPHCDFAYKCCARVSSWRSPDWLGVTSAGVILDLVGEVDDQLGSFCQVGPPDGMVIQRWWNAREPGQRTWVGRCERWEAPVEDGGHVACGFEVASSGGCQHVAEWVLSSFGREGEQVNSQGWPGGFGGESGEVRVGLVGFCDGLGSEGLFGCDVEAVGVALDRLEEPGRWVVELAQQGGAGDGRFVAGDDLLQGLGRCAR